MIIDDVVYKIFDDGFAFTTIDNISYLQSIEGVFAKDILETDKIKVSIFTEKDVNLKNSCSINNVAYNYNGKNRTKLKVVITNQVVSWKKENGVWVIRTRVHTFGRIRPYKKTWGIWFHARRTINGRIKYQGQYLKGTTSKITVNEDISPKRSYSQTRIKNSSTFTQSFASNLQFNYIDSWGDTPSTGSVSIDCN